MSIYEESSKVEFNPGSPEVLAPLGQGSSTVTVELDENKGLGTLLIVISAIGFALMAIFAKFAYAAGLNITTVLSWRFLIAAGVMWVLLLVKGENPRVTRSQLVSLLALGALGYGVMSTCFFYAVKLIPASMASILLYTYPIIVTLLSAWIYKEAITRKKLMALVISSVGLLLVVGVVFQGLNGQGVMFGALAAVVYSLYIVTSNKLVSTVNPLVVTTYVISSAAVVLTVTGLISGTITWQLNGQGLLAILAIAIISTVVAILTFFQGMRLVGPSQASIISTLEPVVTTMSAWALFGEKLSISQVFGGILVLTAVLLVQGKES